MPSQLQRRISFTFYEGEMDKGGLEQRMSKDMWVSSYTPP